MTRRTISLALVAAPLVGITHFMLVYLAAEAACAPAVEGFGTGLLRVAIYATTAVGLATVLAVAVALARVARRPAGRFLGVTGLLLCGLFLAFVLFVTGPAVGSSLC